MNKERSIKNVPIWVWVVLGILLIIILSYFFDSGSNDNSGSLEDYQECVDWCLIELHECQFPNRNNETKVVLCISKLNMCENDCELNPKTKTIELFNKYGLS